ncbi:bifunctional Zinc finger C2H2-type/Zinc finger C2H2 superfamily [Babesia duncani]|uniref:Bifunctional Zinc finger C2H2-type/Zinc finger C2H2 superfamily n=1 Tax=Babesia duncani TaxID=323732 RepID=A0AAD9PJE1_9APIC|nr:bifunctional Zinc finger C2H2-type/Zinc finger C2H2 superfamily [Babesia duncani]
MSSFWFFRRKPEEPEHIEKKPTARKCNYYNCDSCHVAFTDSSNLRRHQRTCHYKEKPHECKNCGKIFGRSDHLKRHLKRHDRVVEQYHCGYMGCKRVFKNAKRLETHRTNHIQKQEEPVLVIKGHTVRKLNGANPLRLACPIQGCSKVYSSYGGMAKHLTMHANGSVDQESGNEDVLDGMMDPIKCSTCEKVFTRIHNLRMHASKCIKTETPKKYFPCTHEGCNNIYTTVSLLYSGLFV